VLLVNDALWMLVDTWVRELHADVFPNVLPLLRRTFATFPAGERRQLGERVRDGAYGSRSAIASAVDHGRAAQALPLLAKILGIEKEPSDGD
jgi:hypothetical protein